MKYNPEIHHRRSIRLRGYDYSRAGLYFITICTKDRECFFGKIADGEMVLNDAGKIAYEEWEKLPKRFPNFELDVFQIMPNHMHGIIVLNPVGATISVARNTTERNDNGARNDDDGNNRARVNRAPTDADDSIVQNDDANGARASRARTGNATVGDIVGAYKSLVANECLKIYKTKNETMGKLWQRNYYEHIIRDEQSYETISNYIIDNPAKWNDDKFFVG
jgi:putative transposase